jgi:hypothetical protein
VTNFLQVVSFDPLLLESPVAGPAGSTGSTGATGPTGADGAPGIPTPDAVAATLYVSLGSRGDDAHDGLSWGAAKATIAGAVTALGTDAGIIQLGRGTHTISSVDALGNCVTLSSAGQKLKGQGANATTVVINANCTWGIKLAAKFCHVEDLFISIPPGITCTYGTGVSPPSAPGSTQYCSLRGLWVQCAGTVTAGIALGPDLAGNANLDVANTSLIHCHVAGAGAATAYQIGNGTSGNVLRNTMLNCGASGTVNGITLSGSGVTWTGGGFSGLTGIDINIVQPGGDAYSFNGLRCESGVQFLNSGYIGGTNGAITLNGCNVGAYTPADAVTLIQHNATLPLVILGGVYKVTGGATVFKVNTSNSAIVRSFTAVGVLTDNATPYPTNTAFVNRVILGAMMMSGGNPVANPAFSCVVDGSVFRSYAAKTANYTLGLTDSVIVSYGTSLTMTLPSAVTVGAGRVFTVKNTNASACTVGAVAGTLDGAASQSLVQWAKATYVSDGANWNTI